MEYSRFSNCHCWVIPFCEITSFAKSRSLFVYPIMLCGILFCMLHKTTEFHSSDVTFGHKIVFLQLLRVLG